MKRSSHYRTATIGLLLVLVIGLGPGRGLLTAQAGAALAPASDPAPEQADPSLPAVAGADADWWATVQEEIRRSEYFVTWQDESYLADLPAAYQAPNRAQNLRTYFAAEGPVVIPRIWPEGAEAPLWRWQSQLAAWGRRGALETVPPATLEATESRITYQRGAVVEWYRNDEDGLVQGFSLPAPPGETQGQEPLRLDLALGGDLIPEMTLESALGGTEIDFRDPGGDGGLRYTGVRAVGARGEPLPAWLTVEGATLSLLVDDSQAVYPVDVEATLTGLPDWRNFEFSSPHADGKAGTSVATAGDVNGDGYSDAIVGVPEYDGGLTNEGKVYLFYGSVIGLLTTGTWQKESDEAGAQFGRSVATAGDVNGDGYADVVIGAPYYSDGEAEEGGVWVYYGSRYGMTGNGIGPYPGNKEVAHFGASVATAGDVNGDGFSDVIVGAPYYNDGQTNAGRVYVYHGSGGGLNNAPNWRAVSGVFNAQLGHSVATAGDVDADGYSDIIVGAPGTSNWRGAAYVWHGSGSGLPGDDNTGTLANADWDYVGVVDFAEVGFSVSTAGDVNGDGYADILVGAPFYALTPCFGGRVLLYLGSSGGVENTSANTDCGVHPGADFGYSVSTAGDVNGDGYGDVIVGSPHFTDDREYQGQVYVWYGLPSPWVISSIRNWDHMGVGEHYYFGTSVATAGDVNGDGYSDILIGAPGVGDNKGRVYGYHGGPDTPKDSAPSRWTKPSNLAGALYGTSVGTAGDVNGDGYADVIVGAPRWDGGYEREGAAWVYVGSASGVVDKPHWYRKSNLSGAEFGASVGTAGDTNGDGYDDVIVGAPYWTNPEEEEGAAFVYGGSSSGLSETAAPLWSKPSNQAGARFGTSVGTAGDVNGDGYADIIVGAPFWQSGGQERGSVWLYYGSDSGPHSPPDWHTVGDQEEAQYGYAVATAGDVNGDGYSDAIVGAPTWHDDVVGEGRAWLYLGSRAGLRYDSPWHAEGNNYIAHLGHSVGTAGDVDGDGYSDVIVGAPGYGDGGLSLEGKAWLFHGSGVGLEAASSWSREGGQNGAQYGSSVGTAGDVNGDGYADILIGAPGWNGDQTNEGGVSLYYGSGIGLDPDLAWHGESNQISSFYGASVATAGDVNGDGYADVIVGAPNYHRTPELLYEGHVFLYYGNGSRGLSLNPRQFRVGADVPIAHLGWSDSMESLRMYTRLQTPFGRGRLQQEIEIKPLGLRFDGTGTLWWGYYADAEPGVDWYMALGNLAVGTQYHWRVRLRYDPVTTPWMPASRWLTMPWNGWNEADFRTAGWRVTLPVILRNYD